MTIQVGIYVAYHLPGFRGAWAYGWAFILPNFLIAATLGTIYVALGDVKLIRSISYGVSPVVRLW
ncbi:MAG: chromate transporter [Pseudomonadota bacterium]